jgi:predicted transcriptional regulator
MDPNQFKELMGKLSEITRLLSAVANPSQTEARAHIISTPMRRRMFKLMNGKTPMKKIANTVGTSTQNVNIFVKDLQRAGLVSLVRIGKGKTKCPKRL